MNINYNFINGTKTGTLETNFITGIATLTLDGSVITGPANTFDALMFIAKNNGYEIV